MTTITTSDDTVGNIIDILLGSKEPRQVRIGMGASHNVYAELLDVSTSDDAVLVHTRHKHVSVLGALRELEDRVAWFLSPPY